MKPMDKQKVLAKVEKLMALANAKGATPNEAETALRQAAILKRQFDLSDAEISAHTVETACVPTRTRRSPAPWLHELAGICASSFGCDYLAAYAMPAGWTFSSWAEESALSWPLTPTLRSTTNWWRRARVMSPNRSAASCRPSAVAASSSSKAGFSQCVRWYVTLPAGRTSRLKQPSRPTSNYTIRS
ncbi:DUF2786 domain-containing protein [Pseudomonas aeruginosa]|nr:DUF2786 domain-containing protein [Pseudomonas aeruginosa]